jgi:coenzyme PQQ precursor peptide PqqA
MPLAMQRRSGWRTMGGREWFAAPFTRSHQGAFGGRRGGRNDRHPRRIDAMKWERPAATDMRFGFEITMYIANR